MLKHQQTGRQFVIFILCWALITIVLNHRLSPFYDEMYYWWWAQDLQCSYFDHPPLIAYGIRLMTHLFGESILSLKLFGTVCWLSTAWILSALARDLFNDLQIARTTCILFLLMPMTQLESHLSLPEAPLAVFWALSIWALYRFCQSPDWKSTVLLGLASGGIMLSKYNGLIFFPCAFIYLLSTAPRSMRTPHPYCALLICILTASPVIIWNIQHHWVSLLYQIHHGMGGQGVHSIHRLKIHLVNDAFYFGIVNTGVLVYGLWAFRHQIWREPSHRLLVLFFLAPALLHNGLSLICTQHIRWDAHAFSTAMIFVAFMIQRMQLKKWYAASITTSIIWFVIFYASSQFPDTFAFWEQKWSSHGLEVARTLNARHLLPRQPPVIFTGEWQIAATMHYALHTHPKTCVNTGAQQLRYARLCRTENLKLINNTLPSALYIGEASHLGQFKTHFKTCRVLHNQAESYMLRVKGIFSTPKAFNIDWLVLRCDQGRLQL